MTLVKYFGVRAKNWVTKNDWINSLGFDESQVYEVYFRTRDMHATAHELIEKTFQIWFYVHLSIE